MMPIQVLRLAAVEVVLELTNRSVPRSDDGAGGTAGGIILLRSGGLIFSNAAGYSAGASATQWVKLGRSDAVGDDYEVRFDQVSGTKSSNLPGSTLIIANRLNVDRYMYLETAGSFRVRVSLIGVGVLATAVITVN